MSWALPRQIEDVLWEATRASLPPRAVRERAVIDAVVERSRRYTTEREFLTSAPRDKDADLAARALFFTVADAPKAMVVAAELMGRGILGPELRVLDVGAGVGAMSLGLLAASGASLEVDAIDSDADALSLFQVVAKGLAATGLGEFSLRTHCADALVVPGGGYDVILAGGVVNELAAARRFAAVEAWLAALAPGGSLVIVEPALRETSRDLHELRDQCLRAGIAYVFAPCTRDQSPCPALALDRDWCHEDRPCDLPPRAASLSAKIGLRQHGLKFSYLVLRKSEEPLVESDRETPWRVVSRVRKMKGFRECHACSNEGRVRFRLLKKNRTEMNRAFERADRGDVLLLTQAEPSIAKDCDVVLRKPTEVG